MSGVNLGLPGNSGCGTGERMKSRRRRRHRGLWKRILMMLDVRNYDEDPLQFDKYEESKEARKAGALLQEGDMDTVVTNTVRLEVMRGFRMEDGSINTVIPDVERLLGGGKVFEDLFEDEDFRPVGAPGKKSTLTRRQVQQQEEAGVLEKKGWSDEKVKNVVKAFTVPKPSGKRRLVVDASLVGNAQRDPPSVDLPSVADVKEMVVQNEYVVQLDGKSWFYQIGARPLREYFALHTVAGWYWLVVLAMGWSWSVWVAQSVAALLASEACVRAGRMKAGALVYIDNFVLYAEQKEDVARKKHWSSHSSRWFLVLSTTPRSDHQFQKDRSSHSSQWFLVCHTKTRSHYQCKKHWSLHSSRWFLDLCT
eukprot:TRINITY_DN7743_c0_g2_i1.p1 TRINITY_DN7743_c0_g2~~TRINITY_DN7743_c0_g2_i1.p1  ORF type:complete len:365 (-),score=63.55 TRINITY_DN7743_c0_g2_i1:61-1155(-)